MKLEQKIKNLAYEVGFDLVGIANLKTSQYKAKVKNWVKNEFHGQMHWFKENLDRRLEPRKNLFGRAVSAITVGLLYRPVDIPPELANDPSRGLIARYAWYDDYHKIMTKMLKELAQKVDQLINKKWQYHIYIDTGPVLEREVGSHGGLGFFGKNTTLINTTLGSYFFLGEIICDIKLSPDLVNNNQGTCGKCRRCQDKCPTQAFVEPYQLDARRCISYLTIEHSGEIPIPLRKLMKNWIYGCDACQEVCPWNKRAKNLFAKQLKIHKDLIAPPLAELILMTEDDFNVRFARSPIKRIGWSKWMRNILIACGNWADRSLVKQLNYYARHQDKVIAKTALWARKNL